MSDWISARSPSVILDPAMGTGILTRAALHRVPGAKIVAYEIDRGVAEFSPDQQNPMVDIRISDFMLSGFAQEYDAALLNPPYIRHREMNSYDEVRSILSARSGYLIPRSANLYIYFVMKCIIQVKPQGRVAALIPTEWMNANFAESFKRFLLENDLLKEIVMFSGCSNIFEDALTTASILFIEKNG